MNRQDTKDFEGLSWHDDTLYGLGLEIGEPERNTWHSDLVLDIDHIVEWVCGAGGGCRFRVAPATLTFHDVTDLRIAAHWGDSGCRTALSPLSIDGIARERVEDQKICLDRPYYRWRIAFNWPKEAQITFGATGFTQTLRARPVLQDEQKLSGADRG